MTATRTVAARGTAPGKVILLGEHAVVYGRTALAAAIDRYVTVHIAPATSPSRRPRKGGASSGRAEVVFENNDRTVRPEEPPSLWRRLEGRASREPRASSQRPAPGDSRVDTEDPRIHAAMARATELLRLPRERFAATISSDLPIAMGLGSSAALSVALVRALAERSGRALDDATICAHAYDIETLFHGFPSGIDNSVATYGGLIAFTRAAPIRPLTAARPLPLVVALGRVPRHTQRTVTDLRRRWETHPERYEPLFDEIDWLVCEAERAIADGDLSTLGGLMNTNHSLLSRLGVSTPELDAMVGLACEHGALGAKLTGGGGGGAVICVCDDTRTHLVDTFKREGWHAFATDIGTQERGAHAADGTEYLDQQTARA